MKDSPAQWLAAAIDTTKAPFKVLSTSYTGNGGQQSIRILNKETGAVWVFTCVQERPPA